MRLAPADFGTIQPTYIRDVWPVANENRSGFFARLMAAREASRRREANRIIGQYRHLIDDGGD
ncbi:MAG: hypothetical protein WAK90_01155 [Pseudolabrys sp.]